MPDRQDTEVSSDGGGAAVGNDVRARLAIALDVDDLVAAERLAKEVRPWFGVAKVGLELYSAAGPDAVTSMLDLGFDVFCDVKLHDIPHTVGRAARVLGALGVRYLTMHTAGGVAMLRAGVDGLSDGAADAGLPAPIALGVTVLTSEPEASHRSLAGRVAAAVEADCGGLVCGTPDLATVRQLAPRMTLVVPGIRPANAPAHDQARIGTPTEALRGGADVIVVGRAVTGAADVAASAAALAAEVAAALPERRGSPTRP